MAKGKLLKWSVVLLGVHLLTVYIEVHIHLKLFLFLWESICTYESTNICIYSYILHNYTYIYMFTFIHLFIFYTHILTGNLTVIILTLETIRIQVVWVKNVGLLPFGHRNCSPLWKSLRNQPTQWNKIGWIYRIFFFSGSLFVQIVEDCCRRKTEAHSPESCFGLSIDVRRQLLLRCCLCNSSHLYPHT